jgi:hypothetical protein
MSNPADQNKQSVNRTGSFFCWVKSVINITRRLIGYFNLTEEEQTKAGIYLGYDK